MYVHKVTSNGKFWRILFVDFDIKTTPTGNENSEGDGRSNGTTWTPTHFLFLFEEEADEEVDRCPNVLGKTGRPSCGVAGFAT